LLATLRILKVLLAALRILKVLLATLRILKVLLTAWKFAAASLFAASQSHTHARARAHTHTHAHVRAGSFMCFLSLAHARAHKHKHKHTHTCARRKFHVLPHRSVPPASTFQPVCWVSVCACFCPSARPCGRARVRARESERKSRDGVGSEAADMFVSYSN
jgi:hypothetical protein